MNTRIILLLLLNSLPILVRGQRAFTISGQVANKDGKGVPAVTIALQKNGDTAMLVKTVSDKKGFYSLNTQVSDNLVLSAEAIGYNPEQKLIANANDGPQVNFVLTPSKALSEVTVTSHKPVYEQKVDRTVFNVENSVTAMGGDAMDALKKTPGVLIMNNQVTIAGKGSVGVMLNGRLQQLTGEDLTQLLHSIPTDNLARIEVITTPPARYDAEGNSGLINLVTKKNLKQGLKGSVSAAYNQNSYAAPSINTSLNYRREKLNLFCNASTAIIGWKYTNRTTTYYPQQTWEQKLDMGSVTRTARIQLGIDYNLTKSSVIGIVVSDNYSKLDNNDSLNQTSYSPGEVVDSVMHTTGHTREEYKGKYAVNLNYEWRIDSSGKKLNVDLDYYTHDGTRSRNFYVSNYLDNGSLTGQSTNRMNGTPSINIQSVKADVELPIKPVRLSFGVKASHVDNKVNNVYETLIGDEYQVDQTKTNAFSYLEDIQAAYVNTNKTIGQFELQLGLRMEHTRTEGFSATVNKTTIKDYTQLFPSGYIQYTPNESDVFSLGYSRRINRPAYTYLNPFRFYYSPNSYAEGNPDLQPSIRNGVEFGYSIKSKYFIKAWAVQVDNYWDRIIQTDTASESTNVTRANLGRARFLGANLNVVFSPAKWWDSRSGISGEYSDFKLDHFGNTSNLSSFLYWLETENSFFLNKKKTWSAEIDGYYYAPRQKDYKRWESMLCVNVGVRATFLDRNLIVGLNGDDIFGTAYWLQTNSANGTREYTYDDERSVRLSITYKFGNKNVKNKRDRSLSTEEMQRANQQ